MFSLLLNWTMKDNAVGGDLRRHDIIMSLCDAIVMVAAAIHNIWFERVPR